MTMQPIAETPAQIGTNFPIEDFTLTQLPFVEAAGLPPYTYTSPDWYKLEVERIFMHEWLCMGRVDQVSKSGDYFTLNLLGEPLVVVRDLQNNIRVLSTVCRHRGMEVVEGSGNQKSFQCPYHLWTFSLDGEMLGAPEMQKTENFDRKQCRLPALRVELWEGFIFANFNPHAKPLAPRLAPLSALLKNYRLSEMCSTPPMVHACEWNWKMMVENFMEPYHHLGLHKDTAEPLMPARSAITDDSAGAYAAVHMPILQQGAGLAGGEGIGLSPFPAMQGLSAEQQGKASIFVIFPNHMFAVLPDSMFYYQALPDGPGRITLRMHICCPASTLAMPGFDQALQAAQDGLTLINDQDMQACASMQRGWSSRLAQAGRYSHLDKVVWQIHQYVIGKAIGESVQA